MLFRDVDGQSHLGFTKNYAGQQIIASDLPIFVYQATPALKNGNFSIAVLIFSLVIFAITLLFWPLNAMLRTHYGYRAELTSNTASCARCCGWSVSSTWCSPDATPHG